MRIFHKILKQKQFRSSSLCIMLLCLLVSSAAFAIPIQLSPNLFDGGNFGVRLGNLNLPNGALEVDYDSSPAQKQGEQVQQGFRLLDGSLLVQANATDLAGGRARFGIRYNIRMLERLGLRAADLRLMRFDVRNSTWLRARFLLQDVRARVGARFLSGVEGRISRQNFSLGSFGVDSQRNLVWGVMDTGGRYAIGAIQVPEPSVISLFLISAGGLLLIGRRSRKKA